MFYICSAVREACAYVLFSIVLFQMLLVLCGRMLPVTGDILGRSRRVGSEMMLFTMRAVEHWSRLFRRAVQSPSLVAFRTALGKPRAVLSDPRTHPALRRTLISSDQNCVILWSCIGRRSVLRQHVVISVRWRCMLMNQVFLFLSCSNSLSSVLDFLFFQMNFCLWTKITRSSGCKNFRCFYFTIYAENNFSICSEYHCNNFDVEIIQIILSWA